MPNWGEHLLIANKLLKKIKINENLFLFGNILPDVQDGYLVKGISNIQPHEENHYDFNSKRVYENFYDIYCKKMDNPIIIGYLIHLITDFLWNDMFYNEKCVKENGNLVGVINKDRKLIKANKKELREYKQKEFRIFQEYIYKNYNMKLPKFSLDISRNANIIENININNEDVKKVVDYIKQTQIDSKNEKTETQIFTIEELEKQIDNTVDFVYSFLKKEKLLP